VRHRAIVVALSLVVVPTTAIAAAQPEPAASSLPPLPPPSSEPMPGPSPRAPAAPPAPPVEATPAPRPERASPGAADRETRGGSGATPGDETSTSRGAPPRDAFYLRLSIGPGFVSATGDGPAGPTSISGGGFGLAVAIGGAPAKGFALAATFRVVGAGGTLNGYATSTFSASSSGPSVTTVSASSVPGTDAVVQLGILADWYPMANSGWHAGASLAVSALAVGPTNSSQTMAGASTGGSLFGGHDWWLGGRWSLGLMAVLGTMGRSSLQDPNHNDTGYSMMPVFFSVEGTVVFF
jgi:hypothetical protein